MKSRRPDARTPGRPDVRNAPLGVWASGRLGVWFLIFAACTSQTSGVKVFPLVDAALQRGELGQPGWEYTRLAAADLDQDGSEDRIVLLANVTMRRGEPVWDDSQVWQVYIEEPIGERSYIFSRRIQLGRLEMRIATDEKRPKILLIEDTPFLYTVYEVQYDGPQDFTTLMLTQRRLDPSAGRPR